MNSKSRQPFSNMAHSKNFKDLTGQKIHRLTFLEYVGRNESRNARWKVKCDCGTIFEVTATAVTHGLRIPVDAFAGKDAFPASKSFCKLQIFILPLQSPLFQGGGKNR